jgi:hypothetical protein
MTVKKKSDGKGSFSGRRGYGWVPDIPDQRDYRFRTVLMVPARLPSQVDLCFYCFYFFIGVFFIGVGPRQLVDSSYLMSQK